MPSVLIVEDDPSVRGMLEMVLQAEGFDTETAEDGAAAIARLDGSATDLVLLDVMMPGADGFEVLRELRGREPWRGTAVIMVTARATDEDVWSGWQGGADYYLVKPFDVEELREVAMTLLRRDEAPPA